MYLLWHFFMVRRRTTDSLDPLKRSGNTAPKFLNSISCFPSVSLPVFVDHKSFEAKRSSKKQHKSQLLFSMPIFSSRYIIQKIFFPHQLLRDLYETILASTTQQPTFSFFIRKSDDVMSKIKEIALIWVCKHLKSLYH